MYDYAAARSVANPGRRAGRASKGDARLPEMLRTAAAVVRAGILGGVVTIVDGG